MMMVMITAVVRGAAGRRDDGAGRGARGDMMMQTITIPGLTIAILGAANVMMMTMLAGPRGGTGSGRVRKVVLASSTRMKMVLMAINDPGIGLARRAMLGTRPAGVAAFGTADAQTKSTVSASEPSVRPTHRAIDRACHAPY